MHNYLYGIWLIRLMCISTTLFIWYSCLLVFFFTFKKKYFWYKNHQKKWLFHPFWYVLSYYIFYVHVNTCYTYTFIDGYFLYVSSYFLEWMVCMWIWISSHICAKYVHRHTTHRILTHGRSFLDWVYKTYERIIIEMVWLYIPHTIPYTQCTWYPSNVNLKQLSFETLYMHMYSWLRK